MDDDDDDDDNNNNKIQYSTVMNDLMMIFTLIAVNFSLVIPIQKIYYSTITESPPRVLPSLSPPSQS